MKKFIINNWYSFLAIAAIVTLELLFSNSWLTIGVVVLVAFVALFRKHKNETALLQKLALPKSDDSMQAVVVGAFDKLKGGMNEASKVIAQLGKEGDRTFEFLSEDDGISQAILGVDKEIKKFNEEEQKRNWRNEGLAKFGDVLRSHGKSVEELSDLIISMLVKYIGANQGAIYFHRENEGEDGHLTMTACYAYAKKKYIENKVEIGQGMVGQCFLEKETLYLLEIPSDYVNITSGLGEATATNLVLVPLMVNNVVYGVVELAAFKPLEKNKIQFLELLAESIASVFASVAVNEKTKKLLEESQTLTMELQAGEEEMRQNVEELTVAQEKMSSKQAELDSIVGAINQTMGLAELDVDGDIIYTNDMLCHVLGYSNDELLNKTYTSLTGEQDNQGDFLQKILTDQVEEAHYKVNSKSGQDKWVSLTFTPMKNGEYHTEKILVLVHDITSEKRLQLETEHQEAELKSQMHAINNTIAAVEFTLDEEIVHANDIFKSITGIVLDEGVTMKYSDVVPSVELRKPQTKMMWDNLREGKFFSGEFKMQDQLGKEMWLTGTFNPIIDKEGKPYKIMMFANFTTVEKEKQKDLLGTVNAIKNATPVIELNLNGTFKNGNKLFFEEFGYKRLELSKRPFSEFLSLQDAEVMGRSILAELSTNQFVEHDLSYVDAFGNVKTFRTTFNAIYNLEDEVYKILVIMIDRNAVLKV